MIYPHSEFTDLLLQLVRIPSVSREETGAVDFLQAWMTEHGMKVQRHLNNLWVESEHPCVKPTVLLNAHVDTVKPSSGYTRNPFNPTVEDGRIYGLGTNDDGASLVALMEVFLKLCASPQPCRFIFSATSQEENGGADGFDSILPLIGNVDFGIIGEPTGMKMAVAEKGLLVLDCTASGKSGHAARNEGVNAIYQAMRDIEWFRTFRFPRVSPFLGEVKMTVTIINAGTQHNVIPDSCAFTVDVRPNGEYTNGEIIDIIRENVASEVTPRSLRHKSSSIPMTHPCVVRGTSMGLDAYGSPSSSNQMSSPFPTLKIGPGESSRSHGADEFVCLDEISSGVEIYYELLNNLQL